MSDTVDATRAGIPRARPHHRPGQRDDEPADREPELQTLREDHRQARAELQRLGSEADRLQAQLATHEEATQSLVDRLESWLL